MALVTVKSILTSLDLLVLRHQQTFGVGDFNNSLKWDSVGISRTKPIILFIEAKMQSGQGSLERKWNAALHDIRALQLR